MSSDWNDSERRRMERLERLAYDDYHGDLGALDRAEDLEEERAYREAKSWSNMGGS